MTMPVDCIVEGVPRSPSAASCPQWQEKVRAAAKQQWSGPLVSTQVIVVITCFSYGAAPVDVDNMAKPILDALKGVVYYDDRPVRDLVSRHRNCSDNDTYTTNPSALLLARLANAEAEPFVSIWADDASNWEVNFEPR